MSNTLSRLMASAILVAAAYPAPAHADSLGPIRIEDFAKSPADAYKVVTRCGGAIMIFTALSDSRGDNSAMAQSVANDGLLFFDAAFKLGRGLGLAHSATISMLELTTSYYKTFVDSGDKSGRQELVQDFVNCRELATYLR